MYDPERVTTFASTDSRNKKVEFGIKAKDRTRHVYVIGKEYKPPTGVTVKSAVAEPEVACVGQNFPSA